MIYFYLKKITTIFIVVCFITCCEKEVRAESLDSLLKLESTCQNNSKKVDLLIEISSIYLEGDFLTSLKYSKQSLKLAKLIEYEEGILLSLINLANAYDYIGRYSEAQKLNFQILAIYKENEDVEGVNSTYNNIGIIHYYLGNYSQAIAFTKKTLAYYKGINDIEGIAMCYNNIANSYSDEEDYDKSLDYYLKALEMYKEIKSDQGITLIKGNVGEVYIEQKKYEEAFTSLIEALQIAEKLEDKWQQANVFTALGDLLMREKKPNEAINFLNQALTINNELGAKAEIGEIYSAISKSYELKGDYKQSLHYIKLKEEIDNDLFSKENSEKIAEMNVLYEVNEKEKEILKQEAKASLQETQQMSIIIGSVVGFLLLFIIVGISVKGNINKNRTNETLALQKQQIETKNKDITDSIQYAKRIQGAILPSDKLIKTYLENSFVLYKPKDIVAGDFYWMDKKDDNILFAAADCTGHGVPGAMVSVVCNNALNRAVREFNLSEPAKILDKVTTLVIETFENSDANIKDGMDIALCSLNINTNELQFSGANNSLYIINKEGLNEVKSDKQPIGKYMHAKPFTNHKQTISKNDSIYLFTDGFADQFGGPKGKKFMYKKFKNLLVSIIDKPLNEQKELLDETFEVWKGNLEQIDDVCVIGVKV